MKKPRAKTVVAALIWINGENFRTMHDAGLLYGPITELLPNSALINWADPAVAYDFGTAEANLVWPNTTFQVGHRSHSRNFGQL